MSKSQVNQSQKYPTPSRVEFCTNPLTSLVYFSTNAYQLASLVEFRKQIGLASLVEFGTSTLALLVYFSITYIANHMRSLGMQTVDSRK